MSRIYLDYNASAPLRPEVVEQLQALLELGLGNPASVHFAGADARKVLRQARARVAAAVGSRPDRIVFTSGATESNASVLQCAASWASGPRDTVLTCATEHSSVLRPCARLREQGLRVEQLEVDCDGRLDPERFRAALEAFGARVLLASVLWVNNETGVIQPLPELARLARAAGVPFHTDAAQALGRLPIDLSQLPVDFASFSAHKLGGPTGVGALYIAADTLAGASDSGRAHRAPGAGSMPLRGAPDVIAAERRWVPLLTGGGQERDRRAGTENLLGSVGFGAACQQIERQLEESRRLGSLRDHLFAELQKRIPDVDRNGSTEHVVAGVLNVSFEGAPGDALVEALDLEGIAVSAGSACHAGSTEPSHVLLAMGLSPERSASAVRISLGWDTRPTEIDALISVMPRVVARVREAHA